MSNANDPAFPAPDMSREHFTTAGVYSGLTKREYFAGEAMKGLLSSGTVEDASVVRQATYFADSLIAYLKKNPPPP